MNRSNVSSNIIAIIISYLFLITSCSGDGGTNQPPPTKPPSNQDIQLSDIEAYSGNGRIKFRWQLSVPSDKSADEVVISWHNNQDSLQVPVTSRASVIIDKLPEGKHTFMFTAVGEDGGRSTPVLKKARVYGKTYQGSLKNRQVTSVSYDKNENTATIYWGSSSSSEIGTVLNYKNAAGKSQMLHVSPTKDSTALDNYLLHADSVEFSYYSNYLPEPSAIDTFNTSVETFRKKIVTWRDYFKAAKGTVAEGNIPPACTDYPQTGGWQSEKVFYKDGQLHYKIAHNSMHNRIPDYSYAGYHYGEKRLPEVPVVKTIGPSEGSGDDTPRIQQAINDVADQTSAQNRGALMVKSGKYYIDGMLKIKSSGVVLRGAGKGTDPSGNTVIVVRGNTPKQRTAIVVGTGDSQPFDKVGSGTNVTDKFVPAGAKNIHVARSSRFSVGEQVYILHPSTQAWIIAVDKGGTAGEGPWQAGREDIPYIRTITKISGSNIYLDAPIYNSLDRSLAQTKVYPMSAPNVISESGIENLHVDIKTEGGEDEEHAWTAIGVKGAVDSWVQNVAARYFSHSAVRVSGALRITVKGSRAMDPVGIRTGSRFYNFAAYHFAQLVLFTADHTENGRHDFVSNGAENASGIVWTKSTAENQHNGNTSEGHRHWTTGLLYDDITSGGLNVNLYNRGDYGTRHGWATANSTVWNSKVDIGVQQPPTAQNYGISGRGRLTTNYPFQGGATGYHDIRPGQTLSPKSLYEAQLCDRLEH